MRMLQQNILVRNIYVKNSQLNSKISQSKKLYSCILGMLALSSPLIHCEHSYAREIDSQSLVAIETSKKKEGYPSIRIDGLTTQSSDLNKTLAKKQLQSYINARYQFGIDFLKWSSIKESDNNNGIPLYLGKPDIYI
jgi:hypothetical protein